MYNYVLVFQFRLKHSGLQEKIILIESYGSMDHFSISADRIRQAVANTEVGDGCCLWFAHCFTHWWPHFTWFFVIFPLLYRLMATFYRVVLCHFPLLCTLMATFYMLLCHFPIVYTLMATFYMVVLCDLPIALHTDGHVLHGCSLSFVHCFTHWWSHFTWFFVICPLAYALMATFCSSFEETLCKVYWFAHSQVYIL